MTTSSTVPTDEPRIDEMLEDATVKAVMHSDRVGRAELLALIEWARIALGKRERCAAIAAMHVDRAA